MRLGLYGGTFDPVHLGHLAVADRAVAELRLDLLLWVLAGAPPHKQHRRLASTAHRLAMLELALAGRPRMAVCASEALREAPGYTADTLSAFRSLHPRARIFFLLGADSLLDLPRWHDPETILQFEVVAAPRPGIRPAGLPAALRRRVRWLGGPLVPVSSHEFRASLRRGADVRAWVTTPVSEYIAAHRLYRTSR